MNKASLSNLALSIALLPTLSGPIEAEEFVNRGFSATCTAEDMMTFYGGSENLRKEWVEDSLGGTWIFSYEEGQMIVHDARSTKLVYVVSERPGVLTAVDTAPWGSDQWIGSFAINIPAQKIVGTYLLSIIGASDTTKIRAVNFDCDFDEKIQGTSRSE